MNLSRKISIIVIISVLLVSLTSLFAYYKYSKQLLLSSELQELRSQTLAAIDSYENLMQLAPLSLHALSKRLQNELTQPSPENSILFDAQIMQFDDGAWRNDRDKFNGLQQAGLFLPPDIQLTPQIKQFYATALNVFDDFGSSATSNPIFNTIWMLGHDRSEVIFNRSFPDFVFSMEANTDYTTTPWMTLASPDSNRQRYLKWTPALFDPVSKTWIVSAVLSLDINNEWAATLGIDVGLDRLFSLLYSQSDRYEGEQHFLIDGSGHFILAGAWQQQLQSSPEIFSLDENEDQLAVMLSKDIDTQLQILTSVTSGGVEYQVIAGEVKPNEWQYFRLVPTSEILIPLKKNLLNASAVILFTVFMLGLFIDTAVRKTVVKPLLLMIERAGAYAAGQAPLTSSVSTVTEIKQLDDALKTMHNELTKDSLQLLESEQRYRQVVTNINEVIIQIDQQKNGSF